MLLRHERFAEGPQKGVLRDCDVFEYQLLQQAGLELVRRRSAELLAVDDRDDVRRPMPQGHHVGQASLSPGLCRLSGLQAAWQAHQSAQALLSRRCGKSCLQPVEQEGVFR